MKTIFRICIPLFSLLLIGDSLAAQPDSVVSEKIPVRQPIESIAPSIVVPSDCIHSHICCQVGCECCGELKRPQQYVEKSKALGEEVERIMVVEQLEFAAQYEKSPVYYQFKKKGKRSKKKYYHAVLSDFGSGYTGGRRLSAQQVAEAERFGQESKLVFDEQHDFMLIDGQGNEQPMPFHSRVLIEPNVYRVSILLKDTRIYGLSDAAGQKIGLLTYRTLQPFGEDGLAIVESWERKYGLINKEGTVIVPMMYGDIERLEEGRFAGETETGTVLIDEKGKVISRHLYERIEPYSEGLAFAKRKRKRCYLDRNGKEVLTIKWEWGDEFHEGLAAVSSKNKKGYIDRQGNLVIDFQFDLARDFSGGAAPVGMGTNSNTRRWGLINREGRFISPLKYSDIREIKDGLARTFVNGKGYGFIKTDGNERMESKYSINTYGNEQTYFLFGRVARSENRKENSLEMVDQAGRQLLDLSGYIAAYPILVGKYDAHYIPLWMVYKKEEKKNLIDLKGTEQLKRDYQSISVFDKSTALGIRSKRSFIVDIRSGKELFEIREGQVDRWEDGLVTVRLPNRTYRYFTRAGEEVIPFGR